MSELTQTHIDKITALREQTYIHVSASMPEWRQLKWNQYIAIYERSLGDITKLKSYEIGITKTMLNEGESYEDGYSRALTGLEWLSQCILYHDEIEKKIRVMNEIPLQDFDITDLDYPIFPLASI